MAEYSWLRNQSSGSRPSGPSSGTGLWGNTPTASGTSSGAMMPKPPQDDFADLGNISINPADPLKSATDAAMQGSNVFEGLKNSLFGLSTPDRAGNHGGLIGDVPVVGDLARFATETPAYLVGEASGTAKNAVGAVGDVLAHVPSFDPFSDLEAQFAAIPDDDPIKAEALAAMKGVEGELTVSNLIGPAVGHIQAEAVKAYRDKVASEGDPSAFDNLWVHNASVMDTLSNVLNGLGAAERVVERGYAGMGSMFDSGRDQLDQILAVGDKETKFDVWWSFGNDPDGGDREVLSPVEQHVYDMVKSNQWTHEQGLDYLTGHGRGFSHDALTQIAGTIVGDPVGDLAIIFSGGAALGTKGATLMKGVKTAETALNAAKLTGDAAKIASAEKLLTAEKAAYVTTTIRSQGSSARFNLIGKLAETQGGTDMVKMLATPYVQSQGTWVAQTGKIARTIIDPMHRFSLPGFPKSTAQVDLTSELVTKSGIDAAGRINHLNLGDKLSQINPKLTELFNDDLGTHFGNVARRVVGNHHRESIVMQGQEAIERLMGTDMKAVVDNVLPHGRRGMLQTIKEESNKWLIRVWDEAADANLVTRMKRMYGDVSGMDEVEWTDFIKGLNKEEKSLLHQATYGRATELLLEASPKMKNGWTLNPDLLPRLILLNRDTLTSVGADGILDRLAQNADDVMEQIAEMRRMQTLYPQLSYVSIDPTDLAGTINQFIAFVKKSKNRLPAQLLDEELDSIPELRALQDQFAGAFTLGFRPEQKYLWGMERVGVEGGQYAVVGDVFVDHVSRAAGAFRAAEGSYGVHGMPVALRRPLGWIEAMGAGLMNAVSGTMIAESAHQTFVAKVAEQWAADGITRREARAIWRGIQEAVGDGDGIVTNPRGLGAGTLFNKVYDLIPTEARHAGFNERTLMSAVMDAYAGDLRHIGATQWLSSRAKKIVFDTTGSNLVGQISEAAWPLLKFKVHVVFQMQERIEPIILNAQRGVSAAMGTKLSKEDMLADKVLQKMTDLSLVRQGDFDMAEQSAAVLISSRITGGAKVTGTKLSALRKMGAELTDVKGAKRVNMLRTFRKGLGKEIKPIYDEILPGEWDKMKLAKQLQAGHLISDDDFAISLIAENMLSNDILVNRALSTGGKYTGLVADFKNAITPGMWAAPSHIGELRPLMLDDLAELAQFKGAKNAAGLRAGLASGAFTMEDLKRVMRIHGADPDYIARVENTLNFHTDDFWARAAEEFHMTPDEMSAMQNIIGSIATSRKMTPADYMSQMFSNNFLGGEQAIMGDLGRQVEIMRAGKQVTEASLGKFASGDKVEALTKIDFEKLPDVSAGQRRVFGVAGDPSGAVSGNATDALMSRPGQAPLASYVVNEDEVMYLNWLNDPGSLRSHIDTLMEDPSWTKMVRTGTDLQALADILKVDIDATEGKDFIARLLAGGDDVDEALAAVGAKGFSWEVDAGTSGVQLSRIADIAPEHVADITVRPAGPATVEDFVRQYAEMFTAHLDPSAKRALLVEMVPELRAAQRAGTLKLNAAEIDSLFATQGQNALADRMLGYINGAPGSNPHTVVTDASIGFAGARQKRADIIARMGGAQPDATRRHHDLDEDLATIISKDHGGKTALPYVDDPKLRVTKAQLDGSATAKTGIRSGIGDDDTVRSYQMFADENFDQYKEMTTGRGKIEVRLTRNEPYTGPNGAKELQKDLDNGIMKVWSGDVSHPVLFPEQVVQYRAVHQFFGRAGEGFADDVQGSMNAAAHHATMYSPDARDAHLSEALGGKLYDQYSDDIVPGIAKRTYKDADDFEVQHFGSSDKVLIAQSSFAGGRGNGPWSHWQNRRVGSYVRALPEEQMQEVMTFVGDYLDRFPGVKFGGFDVGDFTANGMGGSNTMAVTFRDSQQQVVIVFNQNLFGVNGKKWRDAISRAAVSDDPTALSFKVDLPFDADAGKVNWDTFGLKEGDYRGLMSVVGDDWSQALPHSDPMGDIDGMYLDEIVGRVRNIRRAPNLSENNAVADLYHIAKSNQFGGTLPKWYEDLLYDSREIHDPYDFPTPKEFEKAEKAQQVAERYVEMLSDDIKAITASLEEHLVTSSLYDIPAPRQSVQGVGHNVGATLEATTAHEFAHALAFSIIDNKAMGEDAALDLAIFRENFWDSGDAKYLSEYGVAHNDDESFAELAALVYMKSPDVQAAARAQYMDKLRPWMDQLDALLRKYQIHVPPTASPFGGQSVKEASKLGYRSQKKGTILDQKTLSTIHERLIGVGRHSESDPSVARASRLFAKMATDSIIPNLKGTTGQYDDVLKKFAMVPRHDAVPYNADEALLFDLATSNMQAKWKDAYRLQYFAQERSMLQRSINHPMFGIYPASYMWGKIAPEMIQFIAQRPFGVRTGAMLDNMLMAQRSVALQREMDPEFDKKIEEVGHNAAFSWLGYMLPTLPWDINSGFPAWSRALAKQGLTNQNRVDRNEAVEKTDMAIVAQKTMEKLNPYSTSIPWGARATEAVLGPNEFEDTKPTGPLTGAEMQPTLQNSMEQLRDILGG